MIEGALDRNGTAMRLDNVLDDAEPETRAAGVSAPALIDAVEPLKDSRQMVARDSDTGVADRDDDESFFRRYGHRDRPSRRVIDGVIDQVDGDLGHLGLIGFDEQSGGADVRKGQALFGRLLEQVGDHAAQHLGNVAGLLANRVRFGRAKDEQVLRNQRQAINFLDDLFEISPHHFVGRTVFQRFGHGPN